MGDSTEAASQLQEMVANGEVSVADIQETAKRLSDDSQSDNAPRASTTSSSGDSEFFERFENADQAQDSAAEKHQQRREEHRELVELDGKAADLFENRVFDTFTIEAHGSEIEFYRPVDGSNADLSALDDQDVAEQIQHASMLLNKFEEKQRELLSGEGAQEKSIVELYEESLEGTELMRKILSAHAVDKSYWDPRVWTVIFGSDDKISEVFQRFFDEGGTAANTREQLAMLQNLVSENESGG